MLLLLVLLLLVLTLVRYHYNTVGWNYLAGHVAAEFRKLLSMQDDGATKNGAAQRSPVGKLGKGTQCTGPKYPKQHDQGAMVTTCAAGTTCIPNHFSDSKVRCRRCCWCWCCSEYSAAAQAVLLSQWGCCQLPDAVDCGDSWHCCPKGTTCKGNGTNPGCTGQHGCDPQGHPPGDGVYDHVCE